jgi:NAD(P)-dependent dehydrogenase (short-subunit alcohol dehydrogenase family)
LDISADGAAQAMVDALLARVSSLDILVHSAGIMQTGSVEEMNLVDFDRAFGINVRAPYAVTQAALPALKISSRPDPLRELQYHPRREHCRSRNTRDYAGRLEGVRQQSPG